MALLYADSLTQGAVSADEFGAGLDGMTDGDPDPNVMEFGTILNSRQTNGIIGENMAILVDQGVAPIDGAYDQTALALNSFDFKGDVKIAAAATLNVKNTGILTAEAGASIVMATGSTCTFQAGVAFSWADQTMVIGTSVANDVTIHGDVTLGTDPSNTITMKGGVTFEDGLEVEAAQTSTFRGPLFMVGDDGGSISSDAFATLNWFGLINCQDRLNVGTVGSSQGDVFFDGDRLRFQESGGSVEVNTSRWGYIRGYGEDSSIPAGATISIDTGNTVAPPVAADLHVRGEIWIERAVAGSVTVSLIEVGVGQIGVSSTASAPLLGSGAYLMFSMSRTVVAADTTPRFYRLEVFGNGQDVTGTNAVVTAEVAKTS